MRLFEGTYKLERGPGGLTIADTPLWRCTVTFDKLEVVCYAGSSRRAFRKAHRAMIKAIKLRNAIKSVKGLCDE